MDMDLTLGPVHKEPENIIVKTSNQKDVKLEVAKTYEEYLHYLRGEDFRNLPLKSLFNKKKQ